MRVVFSVTLLLFTTGAAVAGGNYVQGHTRSDGTYVQPHYRTNPDSNRFNNYSTEGNYNPYTGKAGTVDPYAPSHNYGLYGGANNLNRRR